MRRPIGLRSAWTALSHEGMQKICPSCMPAPQLTAASTPRLPRHPPRVIHFLTQGECKRLLVVIKTRRDRAIFLLAYWHGLRASELGLLQCTEVNLAQGRLRWWCVVPTLMLDEALVPMRAAKENGAVAVCLRPLEGNHCLTDPYFYPIFKEASRFDLAIAVHIAKGNPDNCDLLPTFKGTG